MQLESRPAGACGQRDVMLKAQPGALTASCSDSPGAEQSLIDLLTLSPVEVVPLQPPQGKATQAPVGPGSPARRRLGDGVQDV